MTRFYVEPYSWKSAESTQKYFDKRYASVNWMLDQYLFCYTADINVRKSHACYNSRSDTVLHSWFVTLAGWLADWLTIDTYYIFNLLRWTSLYL